MALELGMSTEHLDVKELAEETYQGHRLDNEAFHRFEQNIGSMLNRFAGITSLLKQTS